MSETPKKPLSALQIFFAEINKLEIDALDRVKISTVATELALEQWRSGYKEASVTYEKTIMNLSNQN
jgi:hypothetical protein